MSNSSQQQQQQQQDQQDQPPHLHTHTPSMTSPILSVDIQESPMIPNGSQVLVTLDIDAAYFVDLSASTSPAAIKERIYAKLGIYDDDHAHFRISRCRAGQPVGQPLDDWQLWDMCMRATKESDPPMLIVLSSTTTTPTHQLPPQQQQQQQQTNYHPAYNNHSPNSPDSYSHLKHDYRSSSAGSRDSPDPNQHLPPTTRARPYPPPPSHPSPIATSFPDASRPSPNSNTPFELPVYAKPRRPSRPQIETPEDWVRIQHPSHLSPESSSPTKPRPTRRPSDPPPKSLPPLSTSQPPLPSHPDPRLTDYHRQLRSVSSNNPKIPSATSAIRRAPPLRISKTGHRGLAGHPPLPTDSAIKIASSPGTRAPLPLRIPRNDPSLQRPNSSNRPSYPPQTSPSFPFPQPTINSHMRPSRPTGQPGYGSTGSSSSNPPSRSDPRFPPNPNAGRPPPTTSSSLSARNPRVSLQIYENKYLDQARPPPRPRTGDGSSPMRPSQFSGQVLFIKNIVVEVNLHPPPTDRQLQTPLAPQSYLQQVPSYSSIPLRPGEILQDSTSRRTRDQSREYRTELEREPAQRRPNLASPTIGQSSSSSTSSSSRFVRTEDQPDHNFIRSPLSVPPLERSLRRPGTEASRTRPFDTGNKNFDQSIPSSSSSAVTPTAGHPTLDAYGGFDTEPIKLRSNIDGIGRTDRRLITRNSDEVKSREKFMNVESNPTSDLSAPLNLLSLGNHSHQIPSSTPAENSPNFAESSRKFTRGRSATTTSTSTGTYTSYNSSSMTRPSTTATTTSTSSATTTPPSMTKMFADFEDDDDDVVGTFVTPMQPYVEKEEKITANQQSSLMNTIKPKLSLNTDSFNDPSMKTITSHSGLPRIETELISGLQSTIPSSTTSNNHTQSNENNGNLKVIGGGGGLSDSINQTEEENIIEGIRNLEDFFPNHDLDKPIEDIGTNIEIDINSPISPAQHHHNQNSSSSSNNNTIPTTPTHLTPLNLNNGGNSASAMARLKGRTRSIRVVAQEKKKLLRRSEDKARLQQQQQLQHLGLPSSSSSPLREAINLTSPSSSSSSFSNGPTLRTGTFNTLANRISTNSQTNNNNHNNNAALLRRKSTKLWGAKIMEVVPGKNLNPSDIIPPIHEDCSSNNNDDEDSNNFSFKWVKGELIGKGSFGQVYLSDRECERQKSVVNALKSEIHLMRDLEHPNIVQYLGFEETTANLSIFLEYVSGGSIGRCLRRHGAFELNVIKYFTSQVLEGLKYLHGLHILHRDLKADNLLVDFDGNVKISDFGISKKSEHVYEDNTQMSLQGSIFWMAPEVVHNPNKKGYSAKVDIWSLGCVVLEMFAGRRPWSDEEAIQAMFKLGAERLRPPVPPDVKLGRMSDHFLAQCFIVDPEARPTADRLTDHRFLEIENKIWRFEDSELYRSIRMPH
ncbi:hypothetical protein PSTT_07358 [Puccinia striiformis]|uniref:Protein kinase domain-containing protein n=1 Tax=Puccinia striiformis TaxID=27350 RepID=A0A2S4VGK1_9BASI|nr:hypothetical protein PSTT_07358 [Puccinia striiformis]